MASYAAKNKSVGKSVGIPFVLLQVWGESRFLRFQIATKPFEYPAANFVCPLD